MTICNHCGKGSYEAGGVPICCFCGRKISMEATRIRWNEDRQPTEAEIQAALDFGKTAEQHLRFGQARKQ